MDHDDEKQFTPVVLNGSKWRRCGVLKETSEANQQWSLERIRGVLDSQNESNDTLEVSLLGSSSAGFVVLVENQMGFLKGGRMAHVVAFGG